LTIQKYWVQKKIVLKVTGIASEGGHSDFSPRNKFDFSLYSFLQKKYGHVSWERLLCWPDIENIYRFLRDEKKREEPGWLKEKIKN